MYQIYTGRSANGTWLAVQVMAQTVGPLDNARGAGRADGDHQDPSRTLLLHGRTPHPQGTASHPASSPRLALAKPVRQRPGATARPDAAFATARPAWRPSDQPTARQNHAGSDPQVSPAAVRAGNPDPNRPLVSSTSRPSVRSTPHRSATSGSDLYPPLAPSPIAGPASLTVSLRWIRG